MSTDFQPTQQSERFQTLKKRHRGFVFPVAVAFMIWYLAYVLLAAYARDFMATPVIGNINIGLLFGFGQFITTFGVTAWYVSYANRKLDPLAEEIRTDLEGAAK